MKEEYISIREFSDRANVSVQSIYKRLNGVDNPLNRYVKLIDNQKMLNIQALQEIYGIEVEQHIQSNYSTYSTEKVSKEVENFGSKELVEIQHELELKELENKHLKEKIDFLESEKKEWKEHIEWLNSRLEEAHKLLDQQQHLCAITQKKIEELEDKKEEEPKKSWWKFWK